MPTTYWIGNGQNTSQVETATVTAVANGGTLTATINGKAITYTCTATDTTTTAAQRWQALLAAAGATVPEFSEETWTNPSAGVVVATAATVGTPFTVAFTAAGGATVTQVHTTANSSQSDVNNVNNWLRSGVNSLPVNGDDVVLSDSSVPLLWNLAALAAVQFNSFTRWKDFTGTVGLNENNPLGYLEYRPTYFQFTGPPAGTLSIVLGTGQVGAGPTRERYNVGGQRTNLQVLGAGGSQDAYSVRFLGTNANNVVSIVGGVSVGIAMLTGETSTIASATVDSGSLALGAGVTFSGTLTSLGGSLELHTTVGTLVADRTTCLLEADGTTFASVTARNGSRLTWNSTANITTLVLQTSTTFDKSQDVRGMTITNSTIDGDTCQVLDPYNAITWTNATTINNQVFSGPFTFGAGRTVKIT